MNYNKAMKLLLAALLLLAVHPVRAAEDKDAKDPAGTADKTTVDLVQYFLKVPTERTETKLVDPFLAVKIETLPKKLQGRAEAKQVEIRGLLRMHEAKKQGSSVGATKEECSEKDFVKPLKSMGFYQGYEPVTEDELKYVMDNTRCTEIDLGCRFTMLIFFEKKKDRVVKFLAADPIMALVAQSHGGGGGSHLFGSGLNCTHY